MLLGRGQVFYQKKYLSPKKSPWLLIKSSHGASGMMKASAVHGTRIRRGRPRPRTPRPLSGGLSRSPPQSHGPPKPRANSS